MENYKEFLDTKPSLEELKIYCRKNKIRGFSTVNKAGVRELIKKDGEMRGAEADKSKKKDKENEAFFEDASVKLKMKLPVKKEYPKATDKEYKEFLKNADAKLRKNKK